jgi:D-alanyl-lipoteichoic acid acyltransferase DltB (MBOAT superfamily)
MRFNSFEFVVFFAAFFLVFVSAPKTCRPLIVLIASYVFYAAWRASFLLLLLATTIVDFSAALVIDSAKSALARRAALATALTINLGILFFVKYADFALNNLVKAAGLAGVEMPPLALNLILPLGVSFYTFQSVGYTVDVYNRVCRAERNPIYYALYVAFFPQLIAGPIERASHVVGQYKTRLATSPDRIASGLWLAGWGLFKKVCIADVVAPFVNGVFANPTSFDGGYTALATALFAVQIYCDFSGYSDIAIGVARMMGIDLMINFRQPYFASSVTEFWRRWHISLSTWFRDYVYIPLGGSRTTTPKWARNTLLVFGVSGLWHGANWTFVFWGLWHGCALVIEDLVRRSPLSPDTRAAEAMDVASAGARCPMVSIGQGIGATYALAVVLVGWVFFRARSFSDAMYVIQSWAHPGRLQYGTFKMLGMPSVEILQATVNMLALIVVDSLLAFKPQSLQRCRANNALATLGAVILIYDIGLWGAFGGLDFIYFQF